MSIPLQVVKGIMLTEMSNTPTELKAALADVINAVIGDLTIHGYQPSSEVDEAMTKLDKALINLESEKEHESQQTAPVTLETSHIPKPEDTGYRDLRENQDDL